MTSTKIDIYNPDLLIAGDWLPSSAGKRVAVMDPSNGTEIGSVPNCDPSDGAAAVNAASAALPGWAASAPRARADLLMSCYQLMMERLELLAELISLENGKALPEARREVAYAAEFFRWYAEEAVRLTGEISVAPGGRNRIIVQYQPIGVALLITPWNFPAAMATRKIAPALAAGCTTILKPATLTPLTAYAIAQIMQDAGTPAGVVNVVTTTETAKLVTSLLADRRIRKLSFTGSTAVGRLLLRQTADHVISCSMELGGNAPFIVFEDADLPAALDGVMIAKMRNGGQACTAANRIYVQESVRQQFAEQLADRMSSLVVGRASVLGTEIGPLVDQPSVDKVQALVADAVTRGAVVLTGGGRIDGDGYFFAPTVLDRVPVDARLTREEIFGPVAAVLGFTDEDEVVSAANDSEFGLAAYVFTRDLARGLRIAERLEAGMVGVNLGLVSDPAAPFGGVKESGLGREGGQHGLLEFTEIKYIAADW